LSDPGSQLVLVELIVNETLHLITMPTVTPCHAASSAVMLDMLLSFI
jgi:hypothetical protein